MFVSCKLTKGVQAIGSIMFLLSQAGCAVDTQAAEAQTIARHEVESIVASEEAPAASGCCYCESELARFREKIRDLASDEVMDLVKSGKSKSFVGIKVDPLALFSYASETVEGLNLDSVVFPSHDDIAASSSAFVDISEKIGMIIDQSFAVFESSDKTAPLAEKIVETLENLKSEGFVDTSNICEFFKKALFKYLNDTLRFMNSAPESTKECFQVALKNSLNSASPKVAEDEQADPEIELYNSLIRTIGLHAQSLAAIVNTYSDIDMPSVVRHVYEIEKTFREAVKLRLSRCSGAENGESVVCSFQLSDAQKDLLFEIEKSGSIALSILGLVYEALKDEHISEYEGSLSENFKIASSLSSYLYSIPFDREDVLAFLDSPVGEELSSIAN